MPEEQKPTAQDVRVIILPEELWDYAMFMFKQYCARGIDPSELLVSGEFHRRLASAPKMDFSKIGAVGVTELSPDGVEINLTPDPPNQKR